MVQLPPIGNAASSILAQVVQASESRLRTDRPADDPAHLAQKAEKAKLAIPTTLPQAKLSEQLFSLNHQNLSKLKMQLFERVGEALGVNLDDFVNFDDFAAEVETAYRLVLRDAGPAAIKVIERETGLEELGLTLRDVIDSMKDPDKNDKVSQALIKKYNLDENEYTPEPNEIARDWL